jgi:flagellar biosynthesis anti-sigma factor FlgM
MRIDLFNSAAAQVMGEQSSQRIGSSGAAKGALSEADDRATLSSDSVSLKSLVATALSTSEVRQDKIDGLRQAIGTGQYQLDPSKIAASIVDQNA